MIKKYSIVKLLLALPLAFFLLLNTKVFAQPAYDNCSNAQSLCPNTAFSGTNTGATPQCSGADGDCSQAGTWAQCYDVDNSVWFSFTTNSAGGDASVSVSNITCTGGTGQLHGVLLAAANPCVPPYITIDCFAGSGSGFSLNGSGLAPNTQYLVQLDGDAASECNFEIAVSGTAVEPIVYTSTEDVVCNVSFGSVTVDSISPSSPSYTYSLDGSTPQSSPSFDEVSYGAHSLTITTADGCEFSTTVFVDDDNNNLVANAGLDVTIVSGGSAVLHASGNGVSYFWEPPSGLSDVNSQTPVASPGSTTQYTLYTYSPEGCQASDTVIVIVLPPVFVYNTFTPNGDGANDVWKIAGIAGYTECEVTVYDRWGQRVFHSNGYADGQEWDGTFRGRPVPTATYYYVIDLKAESDDRDAELFKGSITIIR